MKRILGIFVALVLALGVVGAVATPAHALGNLQGEVYYVYNSDCGGSNPWHSTGTYWWCVNRLVEIQTLSHNASYTTGVVSYCYTEAKIGAKHERCMEVELVWDSYQHQTVIGRMLAYWTNS